MIPVQTATVGVNVRRPLEGKAVLVTGAGGGIGSAAAAVFATGGAKVVLSDINAERGRAATAAIVASGGEARFLQADLSTEEGVAALVAGARAAYGRLDGAFNNAGTEQHGKALHELTTEEWNHTILVDLTAVFWCLKHQVKTMLQDGGGAIVNTASGLGQVAIPNASEYVAAKHGVIGLTRAAAVEYGARGIRTNCLLPGIVKTPLIARLSEDPGFAGAMDYMRGRHPIGRFAEPAEIGEAAMWLLSDAASFANGMAMAIDGGFLAG